MVRMVRRKPRQRSVRRMRPLRMPLLVVRTATNETSRSPQATGEVRHVGLT